MSSMMYDKKAEATKAASAKKTSAFSQVSPSSATSTQKVPLYTNIWGNQPPPGLRLQTQPASPRLDKDHEQKGSLHEGTTYGGEESRIPVYSSHPPAIQTKLKVNQPGDVYEQEADQVAEQVMRMATPEASVSDDEDEAKNSLMRKQGTGLEAITTTESADVPSIVHTVLSSGGGQPLDMTTREFMEPRFGDDFSKVRIHADEQAAESARAINALGYTVGQDIVFGTGQYAPNTNAGKKLLAHELAHVVQQSLTPERSQNTNASRVPPTIQRREPKPTHFVRWKESEIFNEIKRRDIKLAELITPASLKDPYQSVKISGQGSSEEKHLWEVMISQNPSIATSKTDPQVINKKKIGKTTLVTHTITITWGLNFVAPNEEYLKQGRAEKEAFLLTLAEPLFHELLHARIMIDRDIVHGPRPEQRHELLFQEYESMLKLADTFSAEKSKIIAMLKVMWNLGTVKLDEKKIEKRLDSFYEFLVHEKLDYQMVSQAFGRSVTNESIAKAYAQEIANRILVEAKVEEENQEKLDASASILSKNMLELYNKIDMAKSKKAP